MSCHTLVWEWVIQFNEASVIKTICFHGVKLGINLPSLGWVTNNKIRLNFYHGGPIYDFNM